MYNKFDEMLNASINNIDGFTYSCIIVSDECAQFSIMSKYMNNIIVECKQDKVTKEQYLIKRIINLEKKVMQLESSKQINYIKFDMPNTDSRSILGTNNMFKIIDDYLQKTNTEYVDMIKDPENIKNVSKKDKYWTLENRFIKFHSWCGCINEPNNSIWNVQLFIMCKLINIPSECPIKTITKKIILKDISKCNHQEYNLCTECLKQYNDNMTNEKECICLKKECSKKSTVHIKDLSGYTVYVDNILNLDCSQMVQIRNALETYKSFGKLFHIKYYELTLNALSYMGIHVSRYTNPYNNILETYTDETRRYIFNVKIYRIVNGKWYNYDTLEQIELDTNNIWHVSNVIYGVPIHVGSNIQPICENLQLFIYKNEIEYFE